MKRFRKYMLSYPDSVKILEEASKKEQALSRLTDMMFEGVRKDCLETINKLLFETAEKMGCSLYDLCFRTIPEIEYDKMEITLDGEERLERNIRLAPVEFDLIHDGGYWKEKYFKLKAKMQELINQKDDGND